MQRKPNTNTNENTNAEHQQPPGSTVTVSSCTQPQPLDPSTPTLRLITKEKMNIALMLSAMNLLTVAKRIVAFMFSIALIVQSLAVADVRALPVSSQEPEPAAELCGPIHNPFTYHGMGSPSHRDWNVEEDDDTLILRMEVPGLIKDDVNITVQQNTSIIKGEAEKESGSRIELPPNLYKFDGIKAETKNGVLKLCAPKVKEEERKYVFEFKVE